MQVLADTNIILRYIHQDSEQHAQVVTAVESLLHQNHEIVVVPQVIYEYWAVATRPYGSSNGLSLTTEEAVEAVELLIKLFPCLPDPPDIFTRWFALVSTHQVSGRPTHDARLAAALQAHRLDALLTLNGADFKRFGLNILAPADLSSGGPTL